jgi:hypothetical protein
MRVEPETVSDVTTNSYLSSMVVGTTVKVSDAGAVMDVQVWPPSKEARH